MQTERAETHLDVHQDTVDAAGRALLEHLETFSAVAREEDLFTALLDELLPQDGAVDLVVLRTVSGASVPAVQSARCRER